MKGSEGSFQVDALARHCLLKAPRMVPWSTMTPGSNFYTESEYGTKATWPPDYAQTAGIRGPAGQDHGGWFRKPVSSHILPDSLKSVRFLTTGT
jgi:hypothetical protein